MKCPFCGHLEDKVVDSRPTDEGVVIRRRRECLSCGERFTTYEKVETMQLMVVKKDGIRQPFDRQKLINGIIKSCEKRPVSVAQIEELVDDIEKHLLNSMRKEVTSAEIGEILMIKLKELDEVAYVRFASVYKQFKDVDTFMEEIKKIISDK